MSTKDQILYDLEQLQEEAADIDVEIINEAIDFIHSDNIFDAINVLQASEDCGTLWDERLFDIIDNLHGLI